MADTPLKLTSIIGSGWAFPIAVNSRGGIALALDDAEIEQSIRLILLTAKGERRMRPTFGCAIHELVFAPNNASTVTLAAHYVREALEQWEPRIEVIDIVAGTDYNNPACLMIEIRYRVRGTNDERNLVYPFYRIPEDE